MALREQQNRTLDCATARKRLIRDNKMTTLFDVLHFSLRTNTRDYLKFIEKYEKLDAE